MSVYTLRQFYSRLHIVMILKGAEKLRQYGESLQNKQLALEKKQKRTIHAKSKHANAIFYYGLWQRPDDLIKEAAYSPSEELPAQEIPLLVGKKVIHTFNEGKWPGLLLSVVAGFPEFYNIVHDCDLLENSSPNSIYTYTLKKDYRNGNLEIVPEV
ncbi:hypothetical protein ACJMK2_033565 [Sinanodonta woodiana]|uniref:Uncharacterized protein n=1 Tax=Sinanodonta woodiana TaxID=1069815 RepID=A0ABD3WSY2_SINWO